MAKHTCTCLTRILDDDDDLSTAGLGSRSYEVAPGPYMQKKKTPPSNLLTPTPTKIHPPGTGSSAHLLNRWPGNIHHRYISVVVAMR